VLKDGVGNGGCAGGKVRKPQAVQWRPWRFAARREAGLKHARANAWLLGRWLALAFVLESLMLAYVPKDLIASLMGGTGAMPILMATLIGIPSYFNGYAALPLVSGLIAQGLSPGAGMAFLVAGGVTSLPAAMAVWAVAARRVFAAYLGLAFIGAFSTAWAFSLWMGR
jgi:uncharacterized protein